VLQGRVHGMPQTSEELIVPLVFHYFSVGDADPSGGLMPGLQHMLTKSKDPVLSTAIDSLGYAVLSNIRRSPNDLVIANRTYETARGLIQQAVNDPPKANATSLIVTIVLLAMFEVGFPTFLKWVRESVTDACK
jgi:hypothetical protein